jgi:para-nitrobenzyl esterase
MIGSNADEATTFDPALGLDVAVDYVDLHTKFVEANLAGDKSQIFSLYPASAETARDSFIRFNTDAMFTQPMRQWADYMQNVSSPAYLYWWNWRPIINGSDEYGAFHAAEIPYVFGNLSVFDIDLSEREEAFAEIMMTIWSNFAKTGDPSSDGIMQWPAYTRDKPTTAVLGANLSLEEGIRSAQVEAITAGYNARRN